MRRPPGRVVLAVVFALFALNALAQVALVPLGRTDDPAALTALQALIGAAGGAAAWGSWAGRRWAPVAAALYGLATAAMLAALGPLLGLDPDARGGLWGGAAGVLLFGLAAAWYLRRAAVRTPADDPRARG
jgi:hypothetical protein